MISEYPKYNEKLDFQSLEFEKVINYITYFRNKKAENNITSEFEVVTNIDNELILKMLKLNDKIVKESNLKGSLNVSLDKYELIIYYDNSKQQTEELENLIKEKETLLKSIQRRENLLSNQNYVSKAPEKIVASERENLENEKNKLEITLKRLEELSK